MDPTAELVIRCSDDMVEAFRARKEQLGLSNAAIEEQLLMAAGTCDKYLGPTRSASLTWRVTEDVMTLFGVELVMRVNPDPDLEAKMLERLERRDERAVRSQKRISQKLLELAQPIIQQKLGRAGGLKRAACLPAKQRSRIARAAAISRWKQHRAAAKAASASEGASA
jgi:hypothetical protein